MIAYFDTSALVPLLTDEPSSARCGEPWSPPATYDPASGKPGAVYINRDNGTGDAWKNYQE